MAAFLSKNAQACVVGLLLFSLEAPIIWFGFLSTNLLIRILIGVICAVLTVTGLLFLYLAVATLSCIDPILHDLQRLIKRKMLEQMAKRRYAKFEKLCLCFQESQNKFLTDLIEKNKDTDYGRQNDFESIKSVDDFQSKHPIAQYAHFKQYMERVAQGEENVLLKSRPVMIAITSGTTGPHKMFPRTASRRKNFFMNFILMFEILKRNHCSWNSLQKTCTSYTHFPLKYTDGGIPMGPSSMLLNITKQVVSIYSTPLAGFKLLDERHALYVHALFALRDRNLGGIGGNFISLVLKIFVTMETKRAALIEDIRCGTLNKEFEIPSDIRRELEEELYPQPDRARELEAEFKKGFQGIAKRIWPHLEIILGVTGGSMDIYHQKLRCKYTEDVLTYSSFLICTEGFLGVNLWPKAEGNPAYVLCPDVLFFEFIPLSDSEKDDPTVLLAENLEVGESYLILLTNTEGLYRYRLDDVYKFVGRWLQAPVVEFQYRIGEVFNVSGKKFPETTVRESILSAVESLRCSAELVDYSCCEGLVYQDVKGKSEGEDFDFVIFIEMSELLDRATQNELEATLNTKLTEHTIADGFPDRNIGGKVHLVLVKPTTFESLLQHILSTSNAGPSQVKVPRKLRKAEWIELLLRSEVL